MYQNPPDTPLLTRPVGVDVPIQDLQIELKNDLAWLEKSFGRAYVGRKDRSNSPLYIFPAIYIGEGEVYDASPNDNIRAYSFFEVEGRYNIEGDYESSGISGTNNYLAPVSLVVWGNLKKVNDTLVDPFPDQNFSQNLLQETVKVIRRNYDFNIVSIEDNLYSVFEPYSCRTLDPRFYYYPYFAFKIRMEVAFKEEC